MTKREPVSENRKLAVTLVHNIMEKGAYANIELDHALRNSALSSNQCRQITEMVNGTVRLAKHVDGILDIFLAQPVTKQNPWLRSILRLAVYQLLFMDKIPDYAGVNEAVNITRKITNDRLAAVANGVLRNIIRQKDTWEIEYSSWLEYLSWQYSLPEWITQIYSRQYTNIDELESVLAYLNKRPTVTLRANRLMISRDELAEKLRHQGNDADAGPNTPQGIRINCWARPIRENSLYAAGYFYVQDEASMLAASILDPQPGEIVYDLCAGLGGKTTHLAELMDNTGAIEAWELYPVKSTLLQENCRRMGITIVKCHTADVLDLSEITPARRVLLDVPCSGLGVLHRRADLRWKADPERLESLVELQYILLKQAAFMTEVGGYLLYSTCTVNENENEGNIIRFLRERPDFKLEGFSDKISYFPLTAADCDKARQGMLTLWPGKYLTDGMFYALLRRNES